MHEVFLYGGERVLGGDWVFGSVMGVPPGMNAHCVLVEGISRYYFPRGEQWGGGHRFYLMKLHGNLL